MWEEIADMPGEIFDFDAWIEEAASDPEFIAQCEKNNAEFDREVSQLSWMTFTNLAVITATICYTFFAVTLPFWWCLKHLISRVTL